MKLRKLLKLFVNRLLGVFGFKVERAQQYVVQDHKASVVQGHKASHEVMPINNNMLAFDQIYGLRTTMAHVLEHCKTLGFIPSTVVDVGVANGTPALYSTFPSSKHLLMEPIKEYEPDLKKICDLVDAEYMLAAASSENGATSIYLGRQLHGSSIMQPPEGGDLEKREIKLVKLDDVCSEKNLQGPYLLKVDVQGAELLVLEGAQVMLSQCELVILEVSFFNFRPDMPDIYEVIHYMKNKGFVIYEIFSGHNRPLDGARAQADIAFVKESGMFRTTHKWTN